MIASNYLVLWYRTLRDIAVAHVYNIDDSAPLRAGQSGDGRRRAYGLGHQVRLRFLATDHGHSQLRQRRKSGNGGRPKLAATAE